MSEEAPVQETQPAEQQSPEPEQASTTDTPAASEQPAAEATEAAEEAPAADADADASPDAADADADASPDPAAAAAAAASGEDKEEAGEEEAVSADADADSKPAAVSGGKREDPRTGPKGRRGNGRDRQPTVPCKYWSSEKGCRFGQKCRFKHEGPGKSQPQQPKSASSRTRRAAASGVGAERKAGNGPPVCHFYNSFKGCKEGNACRFLHMRGVKIPVQCQFYSTTGCLMGDQCQYQHAGPPAAGRQMMPFVPPMTSQTTQPAGAVLDTEAAARMIRGSLGMPQSPSK